MVTKLCAVDSLYVASFGRRKTWLVPVQYLIGVTMFVLSLKVIFLVSCSVPTISSRWMITLESTLM